MINKLKGCPFCGSKPVFKTVDKSNYDDYEDRHFISCPECSWVEFESRNKEYLIATWNMRATPKHETTKGWIHVEDNLIQTPEIVKEQLREVIADHYEGYHKNLVDYSKDAIKHIDELDQYIKKLEESK